MTTEKNTRFGRAVQSHLHSPATWWDTTFATPCCLSRCPHNKQSSPAVHESSWPSPRGWNIIALWLVDRYNVIFWLVGVLRGWEVHKTNQIAPPEMSGRSLLVKNYNSQIWLAELTWIGSDPSDRIGSDRIGPRVEVFRTYHYHNHGYEYLRVTSFKVLSIVVYFALFTVGILW